MNNPFAIYWLVGVCFVLVYNIISMVYIKSLKKAYIPPEKHKPLLSIITMNLLITLIYPIVIMSMMLDTLRNEQQHRFILTKMVEIEELIQAKEAIGRTPKEKINETVRSDTEKKQP